MSLTVFYGEIMYQALSEQVIDKIILYILKLGSGFATFSKTQCYPLLGSFQKETILGLCIYLIKISYQLFGNSVYGNKLLFKIWKRWKKKSKGKSKALKLKSQIA